MQGSETAVNGHLGSVLFERNPARWSKIINSIVCSVDVVVPTSSNFFGELSRSKVGPLELLRIDSACEFARRDRQHIAHDSQDNALLMFIEEGELRIKQRGKELVMPRRTAVLYDLSLPYTFYHSERTKLIAAKVPISALKSRLGRHMRFMGRTYSDECGALTLTSKFLHALTDEIGRLPSNVALEYAARSFDLIALMLESCEGSKPIPHSETLSSLYERALSEIDSDLSNVALGPSEIARRIGVSRRYLHKVFQESGVSFCKSLLERRLLKAHDNLKSETKVSLSIGEIASAAGFSSLSHFSRSFRKRFGYSATYLRRK